MLNKLLITFLLLINLKQFAADSLSDNDKATLNICAGIAAFDLKDYKQAIPLLQQVTEILIDNYKLWIRGHSALGKACNALCMFEQAKRHFELVYESHKLYSIRNVVALSTERGLDNDRETPQEYAHAIFFLAKIYQEEALRNFCDRSKTREEKNKILRLAYSFIDLGTYLARENEYLPFPCVEFFQKIKRQLSVLYG